MQDPMPSGWFPDPLGRYDHRYFNGTSWTSDVSTGGQRAIDPLGTGQGAAGSSSNTAATAAVVMGSVGLALAWIPFVVVIGGTLAILAVVFGIRGLRRASTTGVGRGAAMAGTVMGGIGIAGTIVGIIFSVMVWREVVAFVEPGPHNVEVTDCSTDGRRANVSGRLLNRDDEIRSYTVFVEVGNRTRVVMVDDVAPGDSADWETVVTSNAVLDECEPEIVIQGPFPYGIEVDPVN